jgi:hypothetical protein
VKGVELGLAHVQRLLAVQKRPGDHPDREDDGHRVAGLEPARFLGERLRLLGGGRGGLVGGR